METRLRSFRATWTNPDATGRGHWILRRNRIALLSRSARFCGLSSLQRTLFSRVFISTVVPTCASKGVFPAWRGVLASWRRLGMGLATCAEVRHGALLL